MSANYIQNLIKEGEHQQQDFKFEITDSKKIARSIVAFANTNGGRLLVGVKDNGAIAGANPAEEFYMIQAAAQMYCKPEVPFETKNWSVGGKTILEVIVPKSNNKPHKASDDNNKWLVYIRVDDKNILANSILIKVWSAKAQNRAAFIAYSDADKKTLQYLKEHNTASISKLCRVAQLNRKKMEALLVNFILARVIRIVFTEKLVYYQLNDNKSVD